MSAIRIWSALCAVLGVVIAAAAVRLGAGGELPSYEGPAVQIALWEAGILIGIALTALLLAKPLTRKLSSPEARDGAFRRHPLLTLFLISFVALFVELMLIRYCNSQIRIFSFYKNVPLIGCFVGLGLGCCLARGTPRHIVLFLTWLLPVGVFLSAGSIVVRNALGEFAAIGSAEHILGDVAGGGGSPAAMQVFSQILMAGFCVGTLVVITLLFELIGRVLGDAFEHTTRLRGYTVNILGSLAGILAFASFSYLQTPPWVWFMAGLLPLLWWTPSPRWAVAALCLIGLNVAAVLPSYGDTIWSRYQKLVGHDVGGAEPGTEAYLVQISDVFYQVAVDLRPEAVEATGGNPFPHYDAVYEGIPTPERVLIVGAGTGNDVAAALRANTGHVDAVDIDPAIVDLGRHHHPERPYDDPRVSVIVDDARHAFRVAEESSYDLVVFGLLDSHTQLGTSSVRLDNYVFTMESLADARRLVKPGGHLAVTAAVFQPWLRDRFRTMLEETTSEPVEVRKNGLWFTFLSQVGETPALASPSPAPAGTTTADLPTDDWPFIYLPRHGIPTAYLWVVVCLVLASIVVLKKRGLHLGTFSRYHAHLFFLGAAFLLMEVHAINRLALLFGTVWLVSAVTIAIVLLLIVCANLTQAVKRVPYPLAYGALALSLAVSYWIEPTSTLGQGLGPALGFALVLLSPVYFAGLIFARSFQLAQVAAPAIGVNILGAVLGGWMEYSTMAFGMRNLVLLAAGLYLFSLFAFLSAKRRGTWPVTRGKDEGTPAEGMPTKSIVDELNPGPDAVQPIETVPDPATVV